MKGNGSNGPTRFGRNVKDISSKRESSMRSRSVEESRKKREFEAAGCLIIIWLVLVVGQIMHVSAKAGIGWAMVVLLANASVLFAAVAGAFIARSSK
jgi:hypothetical protein